MAISLFVRVARPIPWRWLSSHGTLFVVGWYFSGCSVKAQWLEKKCCLLNFISLEHLRHDPRTLTTPTSSSLFCLIARRFRTVVSLLFSVQKSRWSSQFSVVKNSLRRPLSLYLKSNMVYRSDGKESSRRKDVVHTTGSFLFNNTRRQIRQHIGQTDTTMSDRLLQITLLLFYVGVAISFQPVTTAAHASTNYVRLPTRPTAAPFHTLGVKSCCRTSTNLNMFMGSDGGILGIGTPELVSVRGFVAVY